MRQDEDEGAFDDACEVLSAGSRLMLDDTTARLGDAVASRVRTGRDAERGRGGAAGRDAESPRGRVAAAPRVGAGPRASQGGRRRPGGRELAIRPLGRRPGPGQPRPPRPAPDGRPLPLLVVERRRRDRRDVVARRRARRAGRGGRAESKPVGFATALQDDDANAAKTIENRLRLFPNSVTPAGAPRRDYWDAGKWTLQSFREVPPRFRGAARRSFVAASRATEAGEGGGLRWTEAPG